MPITWDTSGDWDNYQSQTHITHEATTDKISDQLRIGNDVTNEVAYWPLDEASGDAIDYSGNNNDGTVSGPTQDVSGVYGTSAYDFNGTSDTIDVADDAVLDLSSEFTVMAWVYIQSGDSASGDHEWWIAGKSLSSGEHAYGIKIESDDTPTSWFRSSGSTHFCKGSVRPTDTWFHMTGSYDGSTLRIIIDGVEENAKSESGSILTSSDPFEIGYNTNSSTSYFDGKLSDIRVFDYAMTATEVSDYVGLTGNYISGKQTL